MKQSILSKFRRLMALSLALLLIVSLTGCFKKDEPDTPDATEDQVQTEPSEVIETEAPTETPTEAPTEAPSQSVMGTVTSNNLNVRSNHSTDSTILGQLPVELRVEVLEQKEVTEVNPVTNKQTTTVWGRIGEMLLPNGTRIAGGWINLDYVKLDGQTTEQPTEAPSSGNTSTGTGKRGTITASELNIRKSASTNSDKVGTYIKGDYVEILEQKTIDGTVWGRTNKGWISMKYVLLEGQTANTGSTSKDDKDDKTTSSEVVSDGKTKVLGYAVIDLGSLNVRSGPGTKYDKVDTVA